MTAHIPALASEIIGFMPVRGDGIYIDCTLGDGGHTELILENTPQGSLVVGIDRDEDAITVAGERLKKYGDRIRLVKANFGDLFSTLEAKGIGEADAFLFDLGVSTRQILESTRGFSIKNDGPLDMRMDCSQRKNAFDIVNNAGEVELKRIFREFGEERFSGRVARRVVETRKRSPIERTGELASIVRSAVPRSKKGIDPATRVFQGLRIEVNGELDAVNRGVRAAVQSLRAGGRVCVISYHSLEDRLIKNIFREFARGCICPTAVPFCVCNRKPSLRIITRKPLKPSGEELDRNRRARSALLRVAEKI